MSVHAHAAPADYPAPYHQPDVAFLLQNVKGQQHGVQWIVAVSTDGLVVATTDGLERDDVERQAAIASGMTALTGGATRMGAGAMLSNLTHYENGFHLLMSISSGACLALFANRDCDLAAVSHAMTELINRVGPALTPAPAGAPRTFMR